MEARISRGIAFRLNAIILSIVSAGLLLFAFAVGFNNYAQSTQHLREKASNILTISSIGLQNSIWNFDTEGIENIVNAIMSDSDIAAVRIMETGSSTPLWIKKRAGFEELDLDQSDANDGLIRIHAPVNRAGKEIGRIDLIISTEKVTSMIRSNSIQILLFALFLILVIGGSVSLTANRTIKVPINTLKDKADQLARGDLNQVIPTGRQDELGSLAKSFVAMQNAIREKISVIEESNRNLEQKVEERTIAVAQKNNDLNVVLDDLKREITEREQVQQELIELSRQAGMADLATGVLHNIGNVLNSLNIVIWDVQRTVEGSVSKRLGLVLEVLESHKGELAEFISTDPKGTKAIEYLFALRNPIEQERMKVLEILEKLSGFVDHMNQIVSSQQQYAKAGGVITLFPPSEAVAEAIQLLRSGCQKYSIQVIEDFDSVPDIQVDRHMLVQILVNLIGNARDAMRDTTTERVMTLGISETTNNCIALTVADTGTGIDPQDHLKLFEYGFTTKEDGHGFGLHTSANAAGQMHGTLEASSKGLNRGAIFTLTLPVRAA